MGMPASPTPEPVVTPQVEATPQAEVLPTNPMDELSPNNKFFQGFTEPAISEPVINNDSSAVVNPMDYVEQINNAPVQENQGADMADAINGIRNLVNELNSKGLKIQQDEADSDSSYQINVTIIK